MVAIEKVSPDSNKKRLKQLDSTHWVERHNSFIVFLDLLVLVLKTLDNISAWAERETAVKATQLGCAIRRSEFVVVLHILVKVFSFSLPLGKFLQKEDTDLASAMELTIHVADVLNEMRNSTETFKDVFTAAQKLCNALNVELTLPRIVKRQTQRCNVLTTSPEEYFRIAVFLPYFSTILLVKLTSGC